MPDDAFAAALLAPVRNGGTGGRESRAWNANLPSDSAPRGIVEGELDGFCAGDAAASLRLGGAGGRLRLGGAGGRRSVEDDLGEGCERLEADWEGEEAPDAGAGGFVLTIVAVGPGGGAAAEERRGMGGGAPVATDLLTMLLAVGPVDPLEESEGFLNGGGPPEALELVLLLAAIISEGFIIPPVATRK